MARRGLTIILAFLLVAALVSFGVTAILYFAVSRGPAVPAAATLVLPIGGAPSESDPTDVVGLLTGARTPTVRAIVESLRKAKVDRRVAAVFLRPTGFSSPYWGKIQEIRDAIIDFRESGKPVYAYLEYGSDREYYLASAADKVFLMPVSTLDLTGVATYELFLRGTLDKVGAYADLHHVGRYKTAVNQFTETGLTEAHREMNVALNGDLYAQIVSGIAGSRGKTEADVRALIDEGPFPGPRALEAGLIDGLAYQDEAEAALRAVAASADRATVDLTRYARVTPESLGLNRGPRIAVIHVSGAIASGRSGFDPLNGETVGADTLNGYLRRVRRDPSIRAIVLRIDSPGGSATASDAIWRELMLTREDNEGRPIVASMSDLAASGGYYVAMAADAIVAQPSTLTGSIGIFGGKFVTGGVYEKLGARIESTSVGRYAEINSPVRPYSPDEAAKVQGQLQAFYDQFVEKVAVARGRTPEEIDQVAQGRVWTGRQAREQGLVDELGGLDRAIAVAKNRAGIDAEAEVQIVVYPPRRTLYEVLTSELTGEDSAAAWLASRLTGADIEALRALRGPFAPFRRGEPLALMPFTFVR
jgi:protease-4